MEDTCHIQINACSSDKQQHITIYLVNKVS